MMNGDTVKLNPAAAAAGSAAENGSTPTAEDSNGGDIEMATLTSYGSLDNVDGDDVKDENYKSRCSIRDSMFFTHSGGSSKRIDYVLVYEEKGAVDERRLVFEKNLIEAGLELETEDKSTASDKKSYFKKIHCPWDVLLKGATILKLKKKKVPTATLR